MGDLLYDKHFNCFHWIDKTKTIFAFFSHNINSKQLDTINCEQTLSMGAFTMGYKQKLFALKITFNLNFD
jgi:hypothetical protein